MGKDCTDDMITSSANQQMKHLSQLMKRACYPLNKLQF